MSKILDGTKLDYNDVLILPKRSKAASRSDVKLNRIFKFYHSDLTWEGFPLCVANMDTTGTIAMSKALTPQGAVVCLHKHYAEKEIVEWLMYKEEEEYFNTFVSIGMGRSGLNLRSLVEIRDSHPNKIDIRNICIDVANGYTDDFVNYCGRVRKEFPNSIIMAGNVCTPEMVQELILHGGVDIVKVGIGPGAVCTTRKVAGVGYPQLSSVLECANAAHGFDNGPGRLGLICADGGITCPGDVAKAFGANADFVMCGGVFAGTDECEGEWDYEYEYKPYALEMHVNGHRQVLKDYTQWTSGESISWLRGKTTGNKRKHSLKFYGMSSYDAQDKYQGERADYRASEGKAVSVPYKGPAVEVLQEYMGGLRSTCAYVGCDQLKHLGKCTTFVRVSGKQTHNTVFGE